MDGEKGNPGNEGKTIKEGGQRKENEGKEMSKMKEKEVETYQLGRIWRRAQRSECLPRGGSYDKPHVGLLRDTACGSLFPSNTLTVVATGKLPQDRVNASNYERWRPRCWRPRCWPPRKTPREAGAWETLATEKTHACDIGA